MCNDYCGSVHTSTIHVISREIIMNVNSLNILTNMIPIPKIILDAYGTSNRNLINAFN